MHLSTRLTFLSFLSSAALTLATTACDGSAPDSRSTCRSSADCLSGTVCLDMRCVAQPDAAPRDAGLSPMDGAGAVDGGMCAATCGASEVCLDGACCPRARACEGLCCGASNTCFFGQCVPPGAMCLDNADCEPEHFCDVPERAPSSSADAGCAGSVVAQGRCLPRPPACAPGGTPGRTCVEACSLRPARVSFEPVVRYEWPSPFVLSPPSPAPTDVMMTPIVVQLDDDDCDGQITERDLPDIVFTTFANGQYLNTGTVHAMTVRDGRLVTKWTFDGVIGYHQLAGGEFHPSPGNELVGTALDGTLIALSGAGRVLWRSSVRAGDVIENLATTGAASMPALADLDQDGNVEVVVNGGIVDGATGLLEHAYAQPIRGYLMVADVDGDGRLDVVDGAQAFRADGSLLVDTGLTAATHPAAVDLDRDGRPEIVATWAGSNQFSLWHYDATRPGNFAVLRAPFAAAVDPGPPWNWTFGMGPITSGDFDADGVPDVAYTGFRGYVVLSGAKLMDAARPSTLTAEGLLLWMIPTREDNGSTGSALFDFDGDGRVEVLYNDTERVLVLDGADGATLASLCNTTGSVHEFPVVADVDGNGEADIVLVANSFSQNANPTGPTYRCEGGWQSGVRVLSSSDGSWVRAPRVWNQHSYHVTNVAESGAIPRVEAANWTVRGLNNFRQNRQPGREYAAPDAVLRLSCLDDRRVTLAIQNLGEASMPSGISAQLLDGATVVAEVTTRRALAPAQSEAFELAVPPGTVLDTLRAVIVASPRLRECRADNNTAFVECLR